MIWASLFLQLSRAMASAEANFFTSFRPIYLWNKLFGLVPFRISHYDHRITISCCDIFYSCLIAVLVCAVSVTELVKLTVSFNDYSLITSMYFSVTLISITIIIAIIQGRRSVPLFESLIEKIIEAETIIYTSENLDKISQDNRKAVLYVIVISFILEMSFCCSDYFRHTNHTFLIDFSMLISLEDIINNAILVQLLAWLWFFKQRFTRINTHLYEFTQSLFLRKSPKIVASCSSNEIIHNR